MNLKDALLREHSKAQAEHIADYLCEYPQDLNQLFNCLQSTDLRLCQRAAWPLGKLGARRPELFQSFGSRILNLLENPTHPAVARNLYRLLPEVSLAEKHQTRLYDLAIRDLQHPHSAIAVKVFAMTVAARIAAPHPELRQELILIIEAQLPWASKAYLSRARRLLPQLKAGVQR